MSDRNLYFQMLNNNRQQRKLQRPLLRGNYIPERKDDEPFYGNAVVQKHQLSFGGADKNLFFQMQEKGKVRLVPFMLKRQFKDLEPGSRIIGSLDTTKEERQASSLVKGIQNISSLLSSFLSEPETDSAGNIVTDSEGNVKYKRKSMQDQLTVARDSIKLMLQEVQVPINDNQSSIIDSFDVDDSKSILSDSIDVISHSSWDESSQEERSELMHSIILDEYINNLDDTTEYIDDRDVPVHLDVYLGKEDEDIKDGDDDPPPALRRSERLAGREPFSSAQFAPPNPEEKEKTIKAVNEILAETKYKGISPKQDDVPDIIDPEYWNRSSDREQIDLYKYIVVRKYLGGKELRNMSNGIVRDIGIKASLRINFNNGRRLDLKEMKWII